MNCFLNSFMNSFNITLASNLLADLMMPRYNTNAFNCNNPFGNFSTNYYNFQTPFPSFFMPQAFSFPQYTLPTFNPTASVWNSSAYNVPTTTTTTTTSANTYSISDNLSDFYNTLGFTRTTRTETSSNTSTKTTTTRRTTTQTTNTNSKIGNEHHEYDALINKYAKKYGVDPALVKAVIKAESSFNPNAVSKNKKGEILAQGLMQLNPDTAAELGIKDAFDPEQNIEGGAKYLKQLLDMYNGDERKALAAYNWGMGNLAKHGLSNAPEETRNYIPKVLGFCDEYQLA